MHRMAKEALWSQRKTGFTRIQPQRTKMERVNSRQVSVPKYGTDRWPRYTVLQILKTFRDKS